MRQVREQLFLGNITDAYSVLQSSRTNITHMLSIFADHLLVSQQTCKPGNLCSLVTMGAADGGQYVPLAIPAGNPKALESQGGGRPVFESPGGGTPALESLGRFGFNQYLAVQRELVRKTVPLRDIESENLLDHLESCLEFIEEAKKSGGDVLVHCLAGISRSASVVTAYLMRTEKLSVNDALASLRDVSKGVCPNDGFMEQLRQFEDMGYKVDKDSPIYKQFHVTALASGAGCSPGLSWLSFLDHANNAVRGNSLRRSPFMNHVHNVTPLVKKKSLEKEKTLKGSLGAPPIRKRIACLCRRSSRLWRRSSSKKEHLLLVKKTCGFWGKFNCR